MAWTKALGVGTAILLVSLLVPAAAGESERTEEDGVVEWRFVSPDQVPFDEGIQVTCLTTEDLRDDPIAVPDPVNEHVRLSCDVGLGFYCDYPSSTPNPPPFPEHCGPAIEGSLCYGTFFNFTGTLRIEPIADDLFKVSYDGTYDDWDGNC